MSDAVTRPAGARRAGSEPIASDLSELLGPSADVAAEGIARVVRFLLNRYSLRYPVARRERDDLVQDVLKICLEQAYKIRDGSAEPIRDRDAWLCRVTHNAVLARYRRMQARPPEVEWPDGFDLPAPKLLSFEERLTMRTALAALDQACRELLVKREVLGESRQDMADALGIDGNTLGVRLHRCRKKLLALYLGEAA